MKLAGKFTHVCTRRRINGKVGDNAARETWTREELITIIVVIMSLVVPSRESCLEGLEVLEIAKQLRRKGVGRGANKSF